MNFYGGRRFFSLAGRKLLENYSDSAGEEVRIRSSNLVVTMVAVLSAIVSLIGLFSVVRCAMRCRGRRLFLHATAHRFPFPIFDRAALRALPIVEYCRGESSCAGADCAICLAEFVEGEKVRVLPNCDHCFHVSCIDTWFLSHSSCPTCRRCCLVEKSVMRSQPSPSDNNQSDSSPNAFASLRGIACPVQQYWNGNILDHRYLP